MPSLGGGGRSGGSDVSGGASNSSGRSGSSSGGGGWRDSLESLSRSFGFSSNVGKENYGIKNDQNSVSNSSDLIGLARALEIDVSGAREYGAMPAASLTDRVHYDQRGNLVDSQTGRIVGTRNSRGGVSTTAAGYAQSINDKLKVGDIRGALSTGHSLSGQYSPYNSAYRADQKVQNAAAQLNAFNAKQTELASLNALYENDTIDFNTWNQGIGALKNYDAGAYEDLGFFAPDEWGNLPQESGIGTILGKLGLTSNADYLGVDEAQAKAIAAGVAKRNKDGSLTIDPTKPISQVLATGVSPFASSVVARQVANATGSLPATALSYLGTKSGVEAAKEYSEVQSSPMLTSISNTIAPVSSLGIFDTANLLAAAGLNAPAHPSMAITDSYGMDSSALNRLLYYI